MALRHLYPDASSVNARGYSGRALAHGPEATGRRRDHQPRKIVIKTINSRQKRAVFALARPTRFFCREYRSARGYGTVRFDGAV